jgi:hypothetical protein
MYNARILVTSKQKGDALEAVVAAIESLILESSPTTKDKTHVIESKKILEVEGVRHEIDLYVTTDIAPGYKAVFIFECKNWKDAVGKNDIILFSDKIDVCSAQHGFLVAKSFTSDAEAQAKKDPRITLRTVTEHDPVSTIAPFRFVFVSKELKKVNVKFTMWESDGSRVKSLDLSEAQLLLNGATVDVSSYMNNWVTEAIEENTRTFPVAFHGTSRTRSCTSTRQFTKGQFSINATDMKVAELEVDFQIHVKTPAVVSHFEVAGRGRVVSVEYTGVTISIVQFISGSCA